MDSGGVDPAKPGGGASQKLKHSSSDTLAWGMFRKSGTKIVKLTKNCCDRSFSPADLVEDLILFRIKFRPIQNEKNSRIDCFRKLQQPTESESSRSMHSSRRRILPRWVFTSHKQTVSDGTNGTVSEFS